MLIKYISFDYFPPFEYIKVDFTEVGHWSPNFEWLGYDSVNFLEGLGSIAILAAIQLAIVLIALMLRICGEKCKCEWGEKIFSGSAVWISILTFIHVTFFEIVVCASTSMRMLPLVDHLTYADKVSIAIAFLFAAIIIGYFLFVTHLDCCRSRQLYEFNVAKE